MKKKKLKKKIRMENFLCYNFLKEQYLLMKKKIEFKQIGDEKQKCDEYLVFDEAIYFMKKKLRFLSNSNTLTKFKTSYFTKTQQL